MNKKMIYFENGCFLVGAILFAMASVLATVGVFLPTTPMVYDLVFLGSGIIGPSLLLFCFVRDDGRSHRQGVLIFVIPLAFVLGMCFAMGPIIAHRHLCPANPEMFKTTCMTPKGE